jgi:addiction module RelE/StbE family toxin
VKTVYRPQFWADVEDGVTYLADNASPEIATRWHEAVMQTVANLEQHPLLGRLRQDLKPPGIRSLVLRPFPRYLLFYRVEGDALEILRVKHGMMNLPALFGGEPDSTTL